MDPRDSLLDLLDARTGVVCAVGAGGKKSLLKHLATSHPGRVAITATVFTTYFQEHLGFAVAIDEDARLPAIVADLDPMRSVAYACPGDKPGRRAGDRAASSRVWICGYLRQGGRRANAARQGAGR
jgi:hypothetical protein